MIRLLIAVLALGLGSLTLSAAQPKKVPKEDCVKPCNDCAAECAACAKASREGKDKDEALAKECEICQHMCQACSYAVASKNPRAWAICELCENICNDCEIGRAHV